MKLTRVSALLILIIGLFVASAADALTLADIQLLRSLGILSDEQAQIAEQAIQATSGTGASIRQDEFATNECLVLNENMARGMTGSAVTALQRFLTKQGHYTAATPSGTYDNLTFAAVGDFQIAQGLVASRTVAGTGNTGPLTRQKIQEISCATPAATSETATTSTAVATATSTDTTRFVRRPRGTGAEEVTAPVDGHSMLFFPRLISTDKEKGSYEYKFEVGITPDDAIAYWRYTLTCAAERITTNRDDFTCGKSILRRAATNGSGVLRFELTNTTKYAEDVGFVAVAVTKEEEELARSTFTATLEPREEQLFTRGLTATGTSTSPVGREPVSSARYCTPSEQQLFIQYIMTRPDPEARVPLVAPQCYPGEVVCTYDYPISFCEVKGTKINSVSICGGKQYFYDGACRIPQW
ncbi:MAG: hypothetical protein RL150_727 [Candidatus Parcubacteria bacterium]|jgi:hypothetical protein